MMGLRSWFDLWAMYRRAGRRARAWAGVYRSYLNGDRERPPLPSVVQIIPTEACNLRCKMCNQWGDNGYFVQGLRPVSTMPAPALLSFLDSFRNLQEDFLLSIHGGEPLLYPHLGELARYLEERRIDMVMSTNGTRFGPHVEALARINRRSLYLLSIDGGEATNDRIRGAGTTDRIREGVTELHRACRRLGTGDPKLVVNYCVNEHNPDDVEAVIEVAREVGAAFVNYNLRWFLPQEKGEAYDRILAEEFGVQPSRAWTGWVAQSSFDHVEPALERVYRQRFRQYLLPVPPLVSILPRRLSQGQAREFYRNHDEVFGIRSCIMPSYWVRIHSSGDLIYCPGHPDIIPGNVFTGSFEEIYHNRLSTQLRRRVEKELLPICNRCCGLYMTHQATRHLGAGWIPHSPVERIADDPDDRRRPAGAAGETGPAGAPVVAPARRTP